MVLGWQPHGVFGGLLVLLLLHLVGQCLLRFVGGLAKRRRHELHHPRDQIKFLVPLARAIVRRPVESLQLGEQILSPGGLGAGKVVVHQVARLPEDIGHARVGDRGVAAHHISRHRQGKLARLAGLTAGMRPFARPGNGRGPRRMPAGWPSWPRKRAFSRFPDRPR